MASDEGGDEGEAVATVVLADDDDRLLLKLVPVLDFVSAQLDIAATVACLNRAFRKDMGVFRAGVDDVGNIALLRGVGGGRRNYVEGHPHAGRVDGPLADTAVILLTRFYTGLVWLDLGQCLVTKSLLLLVPDTFPNLRFLMLHNIQKRLERTEVWAHNAKFWGPDRVCPQTVKRLTLRMPKLRVVAHTANVCLHHPTGSPQYLLAPACRSIRTIYHHYLTSPHARRAPRVAELLFRGRRIRDDETFLGLHAQLRETDGNDDSWFEPLEIHARYAQLPEEPQPSDEQAPEEPPQSEEDQLDRNLDALLEEILAQRPNQVDGRRRRDWQPQQEG